MPSNMKKTLLLLSLLPVLAAPAVSFAISVTDPVIYLDENLQGEIVCDNPESESIFIYVFDADGIAHNATECADPDIVTLYNPAGHIPGYNVQFNSADIGNGIRAGENVYIVEADNSEDEFCLVSFSDCTTLGDIIGSATIPVYATAGAVSGSPALFGLPTSTAGSVGGAITDTVQEPGLLMIIIMAASFPLAFWLMHKLLGLINTKK